jgi:hypothetical protein
MSNLRPNETRFSEEILQVDDRDGGQTGDAVRSVWGNHGEPICYCDEVGRDRWPPAHVRVRVERQAGAGSRRVSGGAERGGAGGQPLVLPVGATHAAQVLVHWRGGTGGSLGVAKSTRSCKTTRAAAGTGRRRSINSVRTRRTRDAENAIGVGAEQPGANCCVVAQTPDSPAAAGEQAVAYRANVEAPSPSAAPQAAEAGEAAAPAPQASAREAAKSAGSKPSRMLLLVPAALAFAGVLARVIFSSAFGRRQTEEVEQVAGLGAAAAAPRHRLPPKLSLGTAEPDRSVPQIAMLKTSGKRCGRFCNRWRCARFRSARADAAHVTPEKAFRSSTRTGNALRTPLGSRRSPRFF